VSALSARQKRKRREGKQGGLLFPFGQPRPPPSLPSNARCPMSQKDYPEALWSSRKTFLFLAALVFIFVQAGLFSGHFSAESHVPTDHSTTPQPTSLGPARLTGRVFGHPIPHLMDDAERQFRKLLSRQSRSLNAAVKEYKRRYGRKPPKGFDQWWRFVQQNKVKMVDEFDGLVKDLEPFWKMTGEEFRLRALQVCVTWSHCIKVSANVYWL
jgi:hypothetical protein